MPKQGYKTTEFWLAVAAGALGALIASGIVPTEGPWVQVAAVGEMALVAMGYTGARMNLKKGVTSPNV
tara:strand:+ start:4774 stop:4977 length:204 start_codon:yes stop_codon:yes gene_type:complete